MNKNDLQIEFRRLTVEQLVAQNCDFTPFDQAAYDAAAQIVADVRQHGESAVRRYAETWDGLSKQSELVVGPAELRAALDQMPTDAQDVLHRTADQIERFARAQRDCLQDCQLRIENGLAGHRWIPLTNAGCYAPGGRYPLPSSVLMTAVTARVAGVPQIWVASPKPTRETMAAAAIAGATGLLRIGGAQAIAALAVGLPDCLPACDVIVGPGNQFVTAAKSIVSRVTRIDMLAGPSELVVVASPDANAGHVAADLLAQAEHDVAARPYLLTDSMEFADLVCQQLKRQLASLSTAEVASLALRNGGYVVVEDLGQAVELCRQIAPEHLSLQGRVFEEAADQFAVAGALFIGSLSAEVFGDYGAGPNHVLPTGGTARSTSGLWVGSFLRFQTYLRLQNAPNLDSQIADAAQLARMEGLEAHARSAEARARHET